MVQINNVMGFSIYLNKVAPLVADPTNAKSTTDTDTYLMSDIGDTYQQKNMVRLFVRPFLSITGSKDFLLNFLFTDFPHPFLLFFRTRMLGLFWHLEFVMYYPLENFGFSEKKHNVRPPQL